MRGEVIRIADALRALIPYSIFKPPISDASPPSRGPMRPSCAWIMRPEKQRAWGMPGARRTRSLACSVKNTRVSHHGRTGTPGIPARNGFNGLFRALPGDRAFLSPSLADMACLSPVGPTCLRELDAGVEASGPHDFAVRGKHLSSARRWIAHGSIEPALPSRRAPN